MGAREELAAIRERAEAALRSGDWADSNREREALSDAVYGSLELVEALEAVLDVLGKRSTAATERYRGGWSAESSYREGQMDEADEAERIARQAIETALTTDTKGDADV